MILPNDREIIPVAPVKYIDIDAIITHSQGDRRAKIYGYISVIFPDEQSFLFFEKGNLYSSGHIVGDEFQPTSIVQVLKKIKEFKGKEEDASLSFFEIDEPLFNMILNKFYSKPLYKNINSKYTDIIKLFNAVLAQKNMFTGFLEFIYKNTLNFILIENGELSDVKFCEVLAPYLEEAIKSNDINILLETLAHLFSEEKNGVYINIFGEPEKMAPQLSMDQIELMQKVIMKTIEVLGKEISTTNMLKYFQSGIDKVSRKIPEFKKAVIKKDHVDFSQLDIGTDEFIQGVSALLNDFVDKLNLIYPGVAVMKVYEAIKDFRYVLEDMHFFENSYFKSLL
ncbi:hypothetical protein J7L48_08450 [bacterium]|nr:hypothetical protein [bacterium]